MSPLRLLSGPRRAVAAVLAAIGLVLVSANPALAYPPVETVHTERVQAGPYGITVGFSTWPLRAMQSLDFTFTPDDGIAGKRGFIAMTDSGDEGHRSRLARHPRKREVWGMDTVAMPTEGVWRFALTVEGPAGRGEGVLKDIQVLPQPGPPMALSWSIGTIPLWALIGLLAVAWRRTGGHVAEQV
ncbi:hypothetical protein ACFQ08_27305 [Streptosporangium algeriense]|uniref:YtkA-like domain-containing protein n=1 Tax=Streptosporangium algeriense TaxID=1682748 RepID=A0ABW3DZ84_9ACTN